jgi:hypothetical protein
MVTTTPVQSSYPGGSTSMAWVLIEPASLSNGCIDKYKITASISDSRLFDDYDPLVLEARIPSGGYAVNSFMSGYQAAPTANGVYLGALYAGNPPFQTQVHTSNSGFLELIRSSYSIKSVEYWFHRNNPDISGLSFLGTQPDNLVYGSWIYHFSVPVGTVVIDAERVFTWRDWGNLSTSHVEVLPLPLFLGTYSCTPPPSPVTGIVTPPPFPTPIPAPTGIPVLNINCAPGSKWQSPPLIPGYYLNDINLPAIRNASSLEDGFPAWMNFDPCQYLHRYVGPFGHLIDQAEDALKLVSSRYNETPIQYDTHNIWKINIPIDLKYQSFVLSLSGSVIPEVNKAEFEIAQGQCFIRETLGESVSLILKNINRTIETISVTGSTIQIPANDSSFKVYQSPVLFSSLSYKRWEELNGSSFKAPSGTTIISYSKKETRSSKIFDLEIDRVTYKLIGYLVPQPSALRKAYTYRGLKQSPFFEASEALQNLIYWEKFKDIPERQRSLYRIGLDLDLISHSPIYRNNLAISGTVIYSKELLPEYSSELIENNTFSKRNVLFGKLDSSYISNNTGIVSGSILKGIYPKVSVSGSILVPNLNLVESSTVAFLSSITIVNLLDLPRSRFFVGNRFSPLYYEVINSISKVRNLLYGSNRWVNNIASLTEVNKTLVSSFED